MTNYTRNLTSSPTRWLGICISTKTIQSNILYNDSILTTDIARTHQSIFQTSGQSRLVRHSELCIIRNSASCRSPQSCRYPQLPVNCGNLHQEEFRMLFSALIWKFLRKRVPILPMVRNSCRKEFQYSAWWGTPQWNSNTCRVLELFSARISVLMRKFFHINAEINMRKSAWGAESCPHHIFLFLNLFHMVWKFFRNIRKYGSNTPQANFCNNHVENEGSCGNLGTGNLGKKKLQFLVTSLFGHFTFSDTFLD